MTDAELEAWTKAHDERCAQHDVWRVAFRAARSDGKSLDEAVAIADAAAPTVVEEWATANPRQS